MFALNVDISRQLLTMDVLIKADLKIMLKTVTER
jgi:hypothetical protein